MLKLKQLTSIGEFDIDVGASTDDVVVDDDKIDVVEGKELSSFNPTKVDDAEHKLEPTPDLFLNDFNRSQRISCCCSNSVGAGLNCTEKAKSECQKIVLT